MFAVKSDSEAPASDPTLHSDLVINSSLYYGIVYYGRLGICLWHGRFSSTCRARASLRSSKETEAKVNAELRSGHIYFPSRRSLNSLFYAQRSIFFSNLMHSVGLWVFFFFGANWGSSFCSKKEIVTSWLEHGCSSESQWGVFTLHSSSTNLIRIHSWT